MSLRCLTPLDKASMSSSPLLEIHTIQTETSSNHETLLAYATPRGQQPAVVNKQTFNSLAAVASPCADARGTKRKSDKDEESTDEESEDTWYAALEQYENKQISKTRESMKAASIRKKKKRRKSEGKRKEKLLSFIIYHDLVRMDEKNSTFYITGNRKEISTYGPINITDEFKKDE